MPQLFCKCQRLLHQQWAINSHGLIHTVNLSFGSSGVLIITKAFFWGWRDRWIELEADCIIRSLSFVDISLDSYVLYLTKPEWKSILWFFFTEEFGTIQNILLLALRYWWVLKKWSMISFVNPQFSINSCSILLYNEVYILSLLKMKMYFFFL